MSNQCRFLVGMLVCAILSFASVSRATPPTGQGYSLVWSDNFATDTALDMTHWTYLWLGGYAGGYNTSSAAVLQNGYLALKAYTSNGVQYASIIGTRYKYQPLYGYMEASIRWANSPGTWSAFWTFGDRINQTGLPHTDGVEMDIAEHRATDQNNVHDLSNQIDVALHWNGYGAGEQSHGPASLLGSGLSTGFHVYGMAWTPASQTFYIDNVAQWTYTDDAADANPISPNAPVSQISEYLLFSTIVEGGSWAGNIPAGGYGSLQTTTTEMDIQYINVYQIGPPKPLAPVNLTVGPVPGGWVLGWNLADNAPNYRVQRATASGGPYTTLATTGIAAPGANYVDTTAVAGTVYYYVVAAVNGSQVGPNSLEASTSAAAAPGTARSGQWASQAVFSGTATYKNITQAVGVLSNTAYQYGAWIRGGGTTSLRVYSGATGTQISSTLVVKATPAWTYYSVAFNSGTDTQVTVKLDDSSVLVGAISVDDVFLGVAGGSNLLINPGFESGSAAWTTVNAGTVWKFVNCGGSASGNQYDGFQSAKAIFTGTPTYDRLTQTAWVAANTAYQYGVWVKGGGRVSLRAYAGTNGAQLSSTLLATAAPAWTYYGVSFNSGSNTQVTVRIDDESLVAATMYVDDAFLGVPGGANLLVNPDFERGAAGWNSAYAGAVWTIGQW